MIVAARTLNHCGQCKNMSYEVLFQFIIGSDLLVLK